MPNFAYTRVKGPDMMSVRLDLKSSLGTPVEGWTWVLFVGEGNEKEQARGQVVAGKLDATIPRTEHDVCKLVLFPDFDRHPELQQALVVKLDALPARDSMTGALARLNALGYDAGSEPKSDDPLLVAALASFQAEVLRRPAPDGRLDHATADALDQAWAAL